MTTHFDDTQLHSYPAEMEADVRAGMEEHLADCASCRRRLVALRRRDEERRLGEEHRVPEEVLRRVRVLPAGGLAGRAGRTARVLAMAAGLLVAVAVGFLALRLGPENEAPDGPVMRSSATAASLQLLAPDDGAEIQVGAVEFRWQPVGRALTYRLRILDAAGDPVREIDVDAVDGEETGTGVELTASETVYWDVSAELDHGGRAESELRSLHLSASE